MSQLKACCIRNFEKDKVLQPKIVQDGELECYWDAQYFEMSCVGKKNQLSLITLASNALFEKIPFATFFRDVSAQR